MRARNRQRLGPTLRLLRRHPRYFLHLLRRRAEFAARYRWVRAHGTSDRDRPKPLVYKLMLNWSCNLRCPMCMLWGDAGWVKGDVDSEGEALDWRIVERVFEAASPANASFILSGGEPLLYEHYGRLLRLLRARRKFAITCTNGLLLEEFLDDIDGNPYPTFLVSLDGPEAVNDALRGKGVYQRAMAGVERVQALRRPPFLGIQLTVMPENVHLLDSFCAEMVERDVDWILLNPGWFISQEQARAYEAFLERRFDVAPRTHLGYLREYDYDQEELQNQLERIWSRNWPIQIASHLKTPHWVKPFIESPGQILGNALCYKQWLRIDVLPNGSVTPCVQYPDLTVGDLNTASLDEIWQGDANRRFQRVISEEPLPVCAKCNNIYQYAG